MQTALSRHGAKNRIGWIGLLAVWILGTSCTPSGPVITVAPSAPSLQVDHITQAPVTAENIADLTAFEVHLSFDANILEVIELKDGGFVQADFVVQNTFDNRTGTIDYAVAQIDHAPAHGSGTLFEIVFRGKAEGDSLIYFRETQAAPAGGLFSNSNGMAIPVLLKNGSLNVGASKNMHLPLSLFFSRCLLCVN